MNKNIFSPALKINRLFFAINALILFLLTDMYNNILPFFISDITKFFVFLILFTFILVLKVFNYKKRFFDAANISELRAYLLAVFVVFIGAVSSIYNELLKMSLQKKLGLGYLNINFPDFLFNNLFKYFIIGCAILACALWLFALLMPSIKDESV